MKNNENTDLYRKLRILADVSLKMDGAAWINVRISNTTHILIPPENINLRSQVSHKNRQSSIYRRTAMV
jgi:hypothetical protein